MKLIIYGLVRATLFVAETILKEHEIVGVSDSFARIDEYAAYKFIKREELPGTDFDYIIMCNARRDNCDIIRESLIELGIPDEKILSFYALFFEEHVDQIMMMARENNIKYDGMILGLSHSYQGINPYLLDGKWCNLAISSEDLYYHEKVFRKCVKNYKDIIGGLKEIIIDLYDYSVFGGDISLSRYAGEFYGVCGGYTEDLHNFSRNVNYKEHDIEKVLCMENTFSSRYAREHRKLRHSIFNEKQVFFGFNSGILESPIPNFYKEFVRIENYCAHISELPDLRGDLFYAQNVHQETVDENTECLKRLIKEIRALNEEIKIFFVLIPRYKRVEIYHEKLLADRRDFFYSIINTIIKDEDITLLNYKGCEQISTNNYFFVDPAHLNYFGSVAFTTMLNKAIHKTRQ